LTSGGNNFPPNEQPKRHGGEATTLDGGTPDNSILNLYRYNHTISVL